MYTYVYTSPINMDNDFEIVRLIYPNAWRQNISKIGVDPGIVNWFNFSKRMYDEKKDLYYIDVSPDVQFFNETSGETYYARGLKSGTDSGTDSKEIRRPRLLILSDPHNKRILCAKYKVMCGCDSKKETLSNECDLVANTDVFLKGASDAVKLGFDGAVVKHDCKDKSLDCAENPLCQNVIFAFKRGDSEISGIYELLGYTSSKNECALEPISSYLSERCGLVKYAKKNNECIRKRVKDFPTSEEIDEMLKEKDCKDVTKDLYIHIEDYIRSSTSSKKVGMLNYIV